MPANMAYANSFQVNPNNLIHCLIIKPKVLSIPLIAIVRIGAWKLESILPHARAVAFNSGHLELQPGTKISLMIAFLPEPSRQGKPQRKRGGRALKFTE